MVYRKIIAVLCIVLLLSSCYQQAYPIANDNTEMWIGMDEENIYYQIPTNNFNYLVKIKDMVAQEIDKGYIFSIYTGDDGIYYAKNYYEDNTEIKYLEKNAEEPVVLCSVEHSELGNEYREYIYKYDDSLFYSDTEGKIYEYEFSSGNIVKRIEHTNCSVIYENKIYYSDKGSIYSDNLNFDNRIKILNIDDIYSAFDIENTPTPREGSVARMSIYKDKIYFTFLNHFTSPWSVMIVCNIDGTNPKQINDDFKIGQFQIYKDKIYFLKYTDDNEGLYCMSLDGKEVRKINIDIPYFFYIKNDYIYYQSIDDIEMLYRYNLNEDKIEKCINEIVISDKT